MSDRATIVTTAILQIIDDAELEPELPQGELQYRIWRYLRDEFDAIAREIAGEQLDRQEPGRDIR